MDRLTGIIILLLCNVAFFIFIICMNSVNEPLTLLLYGLVIGILLGLFIMGLIFLIRNATRGLFWWTADSRIIRKLIEIYRLPRIVKIYGILTFLFTVLAVIYAIGYSVRNDCLNSLTEKTPETIEEFYIQEKSKESCNNFYSFDLDQMLTAITVFGFLFTILGTFLAVKSANVRQD